MPNGEATDQEMPGKSGSDDEPQGAAFSGGETLMGTHSGPVNIHFKLHFKPCLFSPLITPFPCIFCVTPSCLRGEFPAGFGQRSRTGP